MSKQGLNVVLGASGSLGTGMVRVLAGQGRRVRAVCRGNLLESNESVELHKADVFNLDELRQAVDGADTIYNCVNMPYTRWPELFPPAMENIIKAVSGTKARMVFADNLYMYGDVENPISETSPLNADGPKGKTRIKLAQMVMDAHERGDIEAAIGRASDFYGPGSFALSGDLMIKPAIKGKSAKALGDIDQPHTWTFTEDYARGLIILGENDSAAGDVWHIPSAPTITTRELIEMFYAEAGQGRPKINKVGKVMVSVLGFFMPLMRELKEMMYEWEKPYIVDHSKFESAFGNPSTPHEDAVAQTIKWFKDYLGD